MTVPDILTQPGTPPPPDTHTHTQYSTMYCDAFMTSSVNVHDAHCEHHSEITVCMCSISGGQESFFITKGCIFNVMKNDDSP